MKLELSRKSWDENWKQYLEDQKKKIEEPK